MKFNLKFSQIEHYVKDFFNQLRLKLVSSKLYTKVAEFYFDNKITSMLVLVLLLLIFTLLLVMATDNKTKNRNEIDKTYPYPLVHQFSNIQDVEMKQYYLSRQSKDNWTKEEADYWFVQPDGILLKKLTSSNDSKVSDILEVSP